MNSRDPLPVAADPAAAATPSAGAPGRWSRALVRLFTRYATVTEVRAIGERFRLVTLQSPGFRGVRWAPGSKLQIGIGAGFQSRTYTPFEWDAATGSTRLLCYVHDIGAESPAVQWLRGVKPGDACNVMGPRPSLDLDDAGGPVVVCGDETAIGLALAVAQQGPGRLGACLLEVGSTAETRPVLALLRLAPAELFERRVGDAHLDAIAQRLPALAAADARFVLAGRAAAIQHLRRALKALGVPSSRLDTKAYWAPGKKGLD